MAGRVYEWYGYRATDSSQAAKDVADLQHCVFLGSNCTKDRGVCSIHTSGAPVIVCPKRLYFAGHHFLREIARDAFAQFNLELHTDGLPVLVAGDDALHAAAEHGNHQVGVFGQGWAGEIKLPSAVPGGARYSVDFTLIVVSPDGQLVGFVPVEVQTLDTTGNYNASVAALREGRRIVESGVGMNWENVNKRILPQLITKGLMLQGERLCTTGMYFVTPEPVYSRIMQRLNGESLREIPKQPGSITFLRYGFKRDTPEGVPLPIERLLPKTISTSDMSLAFISPQNLPPAGSYEALILKKIV